MPCKQERRNSLTHSGSLISLTKINMDVANSVKSDSKRNPFEDLDVRIIEDMPN
jgi:hypothetical protein